MHATAAVLPTVLAVGEQVGATGEECLVAAVAGYEAVCRIAAAAPHAFHARGLHATSVSGVFASALVASRLMGLDAATTVNALGIAGSQAGGLLEFLATGSSTKQLHPGLAEPVRDPRRAARRRRRGRPGLGARGRARALRRAGRHQGPRVRRRRRARRALGVLPGDHQALPVLPAHARGPRRGPHPAAPVRRGGERDRGGPPRQRRHRVRAAGRQARAADGVRRQVLAPVEPGRPGRRRRGHGRHLHRGGADPAGGPRPRPPGRGAGQALPGRRRGRPRPGRGPARRRRGARRLGAAQRRRPGPPARRGGVPGQAGRQRRRRGPRAGAGRGGRGLGEGARPGRSPGVPDSCDDLRCPDPAGRRRTARSCTPATSSRSTPGASTAPASSWGSTGSASTTP